MNAIALCSNPSFTESADRYCTKLHDAVAESRERLISRYEELLPHHGTLIRHAVAFAEYEAWETQFPHLLFPDFAEARLAAVLPRFHTDSLQAA